MPHGLPESEIFVLLAHRHRRELLRILNESGGSLRTFEVATRIAERDFDRPSAEDRRAVRLALYHDHLPRLEDGDVVAYDEAEGTVRPGVNFDTVVGVLERATEFEYDWSDQ